MNFGVKVEYVIKDVIDEKPIKTSKRQNNKNRNSFPTPNTSTVPANQNHLSSISTNKVNVFDPKMQNISSSRNISNIEIMKLPSKLPSRRPNSAICTSKHRIDPKSKLESEYETDWDVNIHCDDRDLLIIEQDKIISNYNLKHPIFPINPIEPNLVYDRGDVKEKKSIILRERLEHHSLRKALNDPLPFYPFLHDSTGIHTDRWNTDVTIPNEDEILAKEWSKPLLSDDFSKSREAFYKQYRIPPTTVSSNGLSTSELLNESKDYHHKKQIPSMIQIEHDMEQSVLTSYSKAMIMNTGMRIKTHK